MNESAAEKLKFKKLRGQTVTSVDLFCGAGGTSTGLAQACQELGAKIELIAVNHWTVAVETHKQNHPWATHYCEAIERIDPRKAVPSGRLKLLVASPECTSHSRAKGGRPMNDQSRAQPWSVLKWAQELYVENILIENVQEMIDWGPLGADNRPMKSKVGETFRAFIATLESMDYKVEFRTQNAADFGEATTRNRLFIICRRPKHKKIFWPEQTHAKLTDSKDLFMGLLKPWKAAKEIIDWSIIGKSIFTRKKPLKLRTLQRIAAGIQKFCGPAAGPYLVILRRHMDALSINEPTPALCAGGTHIALAEPVISDFIVTAGGAEGQGRNPKSVNDQIGTILPHDRRALIQPKMAFMVPFYNEREGQAPRTHDVNQPTPAIPATGSGKFAVIEPKAFVITPGGTDIGVGRDVKDPLATVMTRERFAVVEIKQVAIAPQSQDGAFLMSPGHGEGLERRVHSIEKPVGGLTCSNEFAVVKAAAQDIQGKEVQLTEEDWAKSTPCIIKYNGTADAISIEDPLDTVTAKDRFGVIIPGKGVVGLDIRFRMLQPHELAAAMGFPKDYFFAGKRGEQVKQIGNAVSVNMAKALCKALLEN